MGAPRFVSLLGLGFGDCGKGVFTDALTRRWNAHTVVRFNGGAQAGHNVVLPDGRHHTFSQFGSGTLVPGVFTVLAQPVVVHPGALLVEEAHLQSLGVGDAFARLLIDRRCRINTPFHQAAGRLRELQRGDLAHGSCGVGFGETVGHGIEFPEHVLRYADLARPALAMQKLEQIRHDLLRSLANDDLPRSPAQQAESQVLADAGLSERWLASLVPLLRQAPPADEASIGERLGRSGTVLFEGAQGVLLDEWKGFHPHTTWSSIHPRAVDQVARSYGYAGKVEHLGILRSYLTRHGAGPFPTEDRRLDTLAEPHNSHAGWQGRFRRGHPDGVLLRYALEVTGRLDGLLLSHLDVFDRGLTLRWAEAYAHAREAGISDRLPPGADDDLSHQSGLTAYLTAVRPVYAPEAVDSAAALSARFSALCRCPVWFGANGPTHLHVSGQSADLR